VDGKSIYIYGEGWNFGEVANNARGVNATQLNIGGTGIGTFNDRIRDAIRGGNPFGDREKQGFANGLFTNPNDVDQTSRDDQLRRLLLFSDHLRIGLAGNLRDFKFVNAQGREVTGRQVLYNGQPTGYTRDPQENIVYTSKHDNETIFDLIQYKAPLSTGMADRVRMNTLALSLVMFAQGVPFFHAGDDMLRSKSLDRDSYNSGDWFNAIDWTFETTNWGKGLPVADKNKDMWDVMRPLLANPDLKPTPEDMRAAHERFKELLQIRRSSPLFRLRTAEDVQARLAFHNTGPEQVPGLIVMSLSDTVGEDLDPNHSLIVVLFNNAPETRTFTVDALKGMALTLHPVQANGGDDLVKTATFDAATGTFTVPRISVAVFVVRQ
jgi:pullulanase